MDKKQHISLSIISVLVLLFSFIQNVVAQDDKLLLVDILDGSKISSVSLQCIIKSEKKEQTKFFISDKYGHINRCPCENKDSVKWIFRHLSYASIDTILPCSNRIDILFLSPQDQFLEDIFVTAKDDGITMRGDSVKFDLSKFRKPHHLDVRDVLNDLPGVEVNKKGDVTYRGQRVGQILIGGRSTAANQFNMLNRALKRDDLAHVKLYPEDASLDKKDQIMTLDLILKPEVKWSSNLQGRTTTKLEAETTISTIKTGGGKWHHAAEMAYTQIPDQWQPQINPIQEIFDDHASEKRKVGLTIQRPMLFNKNSNEVKSQNTFYGYYNSLYETKKSKLLFYGRYKNNAPEFSNYKTSYDIETGIPIWQEFSRTNSRSESFYSKLNWNFAAAENLKFKFGSNYFLDKKRNQYQGSTNYPQSYNQSNEAQQQFNEEQFNLTSLASWDIDSFLKVQLGLQYFRSDQNHNNQISADSTIYELTAPNNSFLHQLCYLNNRVQHEWSSGLRLDKTWTTRKQAIFLLINYAETDWNEKSETKQKIKYRNGFNIQADQARKWFNSELGCTIELSKFRFKTALNYQYFNWLSNGRTSDEGHPNVKASITYNFDKVNGLVFSYNSTTEWIDLDKNWLGVKPNNIQSYNLGGIIQHPVVRRERYSFGWYEFSLSKQNFTNLNVSYSQQPIHYQWRQTNYNTYSVDTLVAENDYKKTSIELSTSRKLNKFKFDLSMNYHHSTSKGSGTFSSRTYRYDQASGTLNFRDVLNKKTFRLDLGLNVNYLQIQYNANIDLPAQFQIKPNIEGRYLIKKLNLWLQTEVEYLWRKDIYNESIINLSLSRLIRGKLNLNAGIENLLNLNSNTRKNISVLPDAYRVYEQDIYGGRIYFELSYKL